MPPSEHYKACSFSCVLRYVTISLHTVDATFSEITRTRVIMLSAFVSSPITVQKSRWQTAKTSFGRSLALKVPKRLGGRVGASELRASSTPVPEKLAWVNAAPIDELQPGFLYRRVVAGLDLVVACDFDGQVYALGNKGTPLGVPLSGGSLVESEVRYKKHIPCHS